MAPGVMERRKGCYILRFVYTYIRNSHVEQKIKSGLAAVQVAQGRIGRNPYATRNIITTWYYHHALYCKVRLGSQGIVLVLVGVGLGSSGVELISIST
jgi:hypothetical protein